MLQSVWLAWAAWLYNRIRHRALLHHATQTRLRGLALSAWRQWTAWLRAASRARAIAVVCSQLLHKHITAVCVGVLRAWRGAARRLARTRRVVEENLVAVLRRYCVAVLRQWRYAVCRSMMSRIMRRKHELTRTLPAVRGLIFADVCMTLYALGTNVYECVPAFVCAFVWYSSECVSGDLYVQF